MALRINREKGIYWAEVRPKNIDGKLVNKVNVRITHDDMFRYATFCLQPVTEDFEWVEELYVTLKDSLLEDEEQLDDYSNWNNTPEQAYKIVCGKLGYELLKSK